MGTIAEQFHAALTAKSEAEAILTNLHEQAKIGNLTRPEPILRRNSYSVAEVATMIGVSASMIYRLLARGELAGSKVGAAMRVSRFELVRYSASINLEVDDRVLNGGTR